MEEKTSRPESCILIISAYAYHFDINKLINYEIEFPIPDFNQLITQATRKCSRLFFLSPLVTLVIRSIIYSLPSIV